MNELELKNLWQSPGEGPEEKAFVVPRMMENVAKNQVGILLRSMRPMKVFAVVVGFIWVGAGATFLSLIYWNAFPQANKFFLFSATIQILLTAIALVIYVSQLVKIQQVDPTDPIVVTQKKLVDLRISSLWATRVSFLQLPVWTTFWWNETMLNDWNWMQWATVGTITCAFTFIAIWLFFNIKSANRDKKWFQVLFKGKEWTPLMQSIDLLEQLEEDRA